MNLISVYTLGKVFAVFGIAETVAIITFAFIGIYICFFGSDDE